MPNNLADQATMTSNKWVITLNRLEHPQVPVDLHEPELMVNEISIPKYPSLGINAIVGDSDSTRILDLNQGLFELSSGDVVIQQDNHPYLQVTDTQKLDSNDIPLANAPMTSSNRWRITLNRAIGSGLRPESPLSASDIAISGESIESLEGSTFQRTITLDGNGVTSLTPSQITINMHPSMSVVAVRSANGILATNPPAFLDPSSDLAIVIDNIRKNVSTLLTDQDVSDEIIYRSFLIPAESETARKIGSSYDYDNSPDKLRLQRSIAFRGAARLAVALPDIVREEIYSELVQYETMDLDKKVALFLSWSEDELQPILPPDAPDTGFEATSFERFTPCF